ncbi:MAG: hypothetical protein ACI959_002301 [Limisphaerales bacterium]|jgi:hypothetical protein
MNTMKSTFHFTLFLFAILTFTLNVNAQLLCEGLKPDGLNAVQLGGTEFNLSWNVPSPASRCVVIAIDSTTMASSVVNGDDLFDNFTRIFPRDRTFFWRVKCTCDSINPRDDITKWSDIQILITPDLRVAGPDSKSDAIMLEAPLETPLGRRKWEW